MLHEIAEKFSNQADTIESFLSEKAEGLIPPLYLSSDIRNSGKKMGVIDTNLFPAGFNNLCNAYSKIATKNLKNYFNQYYPNSKKIIILSEEHTRNRYYLENLAKLYSLLQNSGLEVRIAYPGQEIQESCLEVNLSNDQRLRLDKIQTQNGVPQVSGFEADLVISNNDFSLGVPEIIKPIENKIIPTPALGWHQRKKSQHFKILGKLIEEFCKKIELDPWLLTCCYDQLDEVNLSDKVGLEELSHRVEQTLQKIQGHYDRYQIKESPYVFIKNNSGTYGMGLMDVSDPQEIQQMNRKTRNKLLSTKGGGKAHSFLIQEGIPTADFYSSLPIEPVIYIIGFEPVGGFFRMNAERDAHSSLNTRGMMFSCLCLHKIEEPHEENFLNCAEKENLVNLSNVMARLAAIAGAIEIKQTTIPYTHSSTISSAKLFSRCS